MGNSFEQGLELHRRGELDRAQAIYRAVLQSQPTHFGAAHLLGVTYLQSGRYGEAERQIRRALAIEPNVPEALNNLGTALKNLERPEEALAAYDCAIALKPGYAGALCNSANALRLLGRPADAIARYDRAIALEPDYAEAYYNRGGALEELWRWDDAVASYEIAVALSPGFAKAHNNLGNALSAACRYAEAVASYDRAIALDADFAEAYSNRGNALRDLRRLEEALASHNRAVALNPTAEVYSNRGSVYHGLCRFAEAIADYERAVALDPKNMGARANLALTRLLTGDWERGLEDYELRFRKKHGAARRPDNPAPEWMGEKPDGRRILLFAEQGFGDTIQFVRYAPAVRALGAEVVVMANPKLHRLLSTVSPELTLVSEVGPEDKFDFQTALMSLPRAFGFRPDTVPRADPYLHADPTRAELWRKRLGGHGFKLGLCWQGNPTGKIDIGRSVPLREFKPLAGIDRVRIISLQKNYGLDQLAGRPSGMAMETPGHDFDDGPDAFIDTAAIMANLDLVVTSDTSIAHLAGALGKPTWVVLQSVPDWRWLLEREDCPWYPSMRLFRQKTPGDWAGVVERLAAELRSAVAGSDANGDVHSAA